MDAEHYSPSDAARERALLDAMFRLDPEWSDPAKCQDEMGRLGLVATALLDQLEAVVTQMAGISDAAFHAALVSAKGDERLADRVHSSQYGGAILDGLLCRLSGLA